MVVTGKGKAVTYSREAVRTLRRMPGKDALRVREKIVQYARDPASLGNNVRKLQGRPLWRLRVGDWRVLFDEDDIVISVVKIGPRGSVYL